MNTVAKIAASAVIALGALGAGTISASAACDGDTSTETVLGAGSGAVVGGLASHSIAGAAIGGVAGGLIGNSIGHANNREDCRRDAYYDRERHAERDHDYWTDRDGNRHDTDDGYRD